MILLLRPRKAKGFRKKPSIVAAKEAVRVAVLGGVAPEFASEWGGFKHIFEKAQFGKCGYCESSASKSSYGAVEHFRPKAAVRALTSRPGFDDTRGDSPERSSVGSEQDGYWWLAYEWTNWLFACDKCNSTWKKNQFPVVGVRASSMSGLLAERPELLSPFDDADVESHFKWFADGSVVGNGLRGVATVAVVGLDRKTLCVARRNKGERIGNVLVEIEICVRSGGRVPDVLLRSLALECRPEDEFAAFGRALVKDVLGLTWSEVSRLTGIK